MQKKAEELWKFLDTLSETDPAAYANFIKQQKEEAAADFKIVPKPAFSVETNLVPDQKTTVFINFYSNEKIVEPERFGTDDMGAIPISISKMEPWRNDESVHNAQCCSCHLNPIVLQRASENMGFKLSLIDLTFQGIEEDYSVKLFRGYKFCDKFMGLSKSQNSPKPQSAPAKPAKADVVLPTRDTDHVSSPAGLSQLFPDQSSNRLKLVEVVNGSAEITPDFELSNVPPSQTAPKGTVSIAVALPGVKSSSQLQIDISPSRLLLNGCGFKLEVMFPSVIVESQANARFKKATATLVLTAPYA